MKQLANVTLALALLLTLGVCRPAASASAEGLLAAHREEIAGAIVQARADLRSEAEQIHADAQEFRADVAAIREEVRALEAASAPAESVAEGTEAAPIEEAAPAAPVEEAAPAEPVAEAASTEPVEETAPAADSPAEETPAEAQPAEAPAEDTSLRSSLLSDLAAIRRERRQERLETAEALLEIVEEHRSDNGESLLETVEKQAADGVKGLVDVAVSDVQAELKDNPIHHDVIVTVDNSRFNRTVSTTPTPAPTPVPTVQPAPAVVYSASMSPKTADESELSLWASLLGLSLLALGGASMLLKKQH